MYKKIFLFILSLVFSVRLAEQSSTLFYGIAALNVYHAIKKTSIAALIHNFSINHKKNGWLKHLLQLKQLKKINPGKMTRAVIFMHGQFNALMAIFFLHKGRIKKY